MDIDWNALAVWFQQNLLIILVGFGIFFLLMALLRGFWRGLRLFSALLGLLLILGALWLWLFDDFQLAQPQPTNLPPRPTPTAISVSFPSVDAQAGLADLPTLFLLVSANVEQGVQVNIQAGGEYEIAYLGDAYSPWPAEDHPGYRGWTTLVAVYINRVVEWGLTPYDLVGPVKADGFLTPGGYFPAREAAAEAAVGARLRLSLNEGDQLLLVAVDERDRYPDNRGLVEVELTRQAP